MLLGQDCEDFWLIFGNSALFQQKKRFEMLINRYTEADFDTICPEIKGGVSCLPSGRFQQIIPALLLPPCEMIVVWITFSHGMPAK